MTQKEQENLIKILKSPSGDSKSKPRDYDDNHNEKFHNQDSKNLRDQLVKNDYRAD